VTIPTGIASTMLDPMPMGIVTLAFGKLTKTLYSIGYFEHSRSNASKDRHVAMLLTKTAVRDRYVAALLTKTIS